MSTKEKLDLLWKYLALIVIAILGLRFTENINSEYISNNDDIVVFGDNVPTLNDNNLNDSLLISWSESYDSDGHDLFYQFDLFTSTGDTLLTINTENEESISLSFQAILIIFSRFALLILYPF